MAEDNTGSRTSTVLVSSTRYVGCLFAPMECPVDFMGEGNAEAFMNHKPNGISLVI